MSPEQIQGKNEEVAQKSDRFSLGVVRYEMLTGQLPCAGENIVDLSQSILEQDPTPPSPVNRTLPPWRDTRLRVGF